MAKKTAKKAKRVVSASELENILIECALAVGQGVGSGVKVTPQALKYWRVTFRATIKHALSEGASWAGGKRKVLMLATEMGAKAAAKAKPVTRAAAEEASDEVRDDPRCPRGMGKFC